jgi:hypothetical protein
MWISARLPLAVTGLAAAAAMAGCALVWSYGDYTDATGTAGGGGAPGGQGPGGGGAAGGDLPCEPLHCVDNPGSEQYVYLPPEAQPCADGFTPEPLRSCAGVCSCTPNFGTCQATIGVYTNPACSPPAASESPPSWTGTTGCVIADTGIPSTIPYEKLSLTHNHDSSCSVDAAQPEGNAIAVCVAEGQCGPGQTCKPDFPAPETLCKMFVNDVECTDPAFAVKTSYFRSAGATTCDCGCQKSGETCLDGAEVTIDTFSSPSCQGSLTGSANLVSGPNGCTSTNGIAQSVSVTSGLLGNNAMVDCQEQATPHNLAAVHWTLCCPT